MKIAIVGAGIMGRTIALRLLEAGFLVTIFDKNNAMSHPNNCSYVAAGLLTPTCELDKAELLIYQLGIESINHYWPSILQALPHPIYYQRKGCLVLTHSQDENEWQLFGTRIDHKLKSSYQLLTQESLEKLEPQLYPFRQAYYFPNEAQIDSQTLMNQLGKQLIHLGADWQLDTEIQSISPKNICTHNRTHRFDWVIDCRGLGAKDFFPNLRGLRGELLHLYAPDVNLQRPIRFLHPRYSIYLVPRPDHHYLVGASELESEDTSAISVRTTLELLTAVYSIHAGFAEARIINTVTQCRPTLPDNLPRIKFTQGLVAVNGLHRHGYLIAPTLAADIVSAIKTDFHTLNYPEIWENFS